jgi:hypothetical protein
VCSILFLLWPIRRPRERERERERERVRETNLVAMTSRTVRSKRHADEVLVESYNLQAYSPEHACLHYPTAIRVAIIQMQNSEFVQNWRNKNWKPEIMHMYSPSPLKENLTSGRLSIARYCWRNKWISICRTMTANAHMSKVVHYFEQMN